MKIQRKRYIERTRGEDQCADRIKLYRPRCRKKGGGLLPYRAAGTAWGQTPRAGVSPEWGSTGVRLDFKCDTPDF